MILTLIAILVIQMMNININNTSRILVVIPILIIPMMICVSIYNTQLFEIKEILLAIIKERRYLRIESFEDLACVQEHQGLEELELEAPSADLNCSDKTKRGGRLSSAPYRRNIVPVHPDVSERMKKEHVEHKNEENHTGTKIYVEVNEEMKFTSCDISSRILKTKHMCRNHFMRLMK